MLSIVTINYNNLSGLFKTFESVKRQVVQRDFFQYIVIDGGSTDGSSDLLKGYPDIIDVAVSEPDKGIYNAMNKGVARATGEYILFLNSGDVFSSNDVLSKLISLQDKLSADIAIACVNVIKDGRVIIPNHTAKEISFFNLFLTGIPHQGTLTKRQLLLRHPFDEKYRINSDFKFFLETIVMENSSVQYFPEITIADYDLTGISSTNTQLQRSERQAIVEEVVPPRILCDYEKVFPHYYEVERVKWLLEHPFFYKVYRMWCTMGRKLL